MGEKAEELRALSQVIRTCRARASGLDLPALDYLLRKAEVTLTDHAARAAAREIPRGPALAVPRCRATRH